MSREKTIDRIRKLLELSKSSNEHEAASAAQQASVLTWALSRTDPGLLMKTDPVDKAA